MLLSNFILFDADAGVTGNGGDGAGDAGATSTGEGDAGTNGSSAAAPTDGETPGSSSSGFSQADVDRIAGQARKQALERKAKDLGFDSYKAMEAAAKAKREADDAAKSDLEKAEAKAQEAATRADAIEQRMYSVLLRSKFEMAAAQTVADVDLAFLAAQNAGLLNSDAGIEVDIDAGQVTGLDKAIEKLLKDKPILKKTQATPPQTGGNESGNTTASGELTDDKKAAYRRRFGIL